MDAVWVVCRGIYGPGKDVNVVWVELHGGPYGRGCSLRGVTGEIWGGFGRGCSLSEVSGYIRDGYGGGCSLDGGARYKRDGYGHGCSLNIILSYIHGMRMYRM